jgi:hypothetical protein
MGRPSDFTKELAAELCARLADGVSLRTVCKSEDMPGKTTVFRWLDENQEFRDQYARAKEESADSWADDIIDIADGEPGGDVTRDRLRVDARKWAASKLKPKKYGDSTTIKGDPAAPITHEHKHVFQLAPLERIDTDADKASAET